MWNSLGCPDVQSHGYRGLVQNGPNGHPGQNGHAQNGHSPWKVNQGCVPDAGVYEPFAYPRVGPVPAGPAVPGAAGATGAAGPAVAAIPAVAALPAKISAAVPSLPQMNGHSPDVADPQIQWWVEKIDAGTAIPTLKSRSVGSMCPTNLGKQQTLRVSDRKDTGQRGPGRAKFPCQSLLPDVPRPLRHPSEVGVAMALCNLEKSQALRGNEIRGILRESFQKAYEAVNTAAKAHEDLCQKTEKLKGIPGTLDAVKRAKICTRDVLLWRWFGLTAWIYNQAESEFFQSYGREIESQLMNSVVKIRQRLMQDLMRKPCWHQLERKLMKCAATDSWTPELEGLLNRFRFMFESLGGPGNPVIQEWRLSEEEEKMEMQENEAKEQEAEQEFEAEVWNNAGRKVSESVVGLLCLDDFDEFDACDPAMDPDCYAADAIHPIDASPEADDHEIRDDPAFVAQQGFVDGFSAIQNILWELHHPKCQVPMGVS